MKPFYRNAIVGQSASANNGEQLACPEIPYQHTKLPPQIGSNRSPSPRCTPFSAGSAPASGESSTMPAAGGYPDRSPHATAALHRLLDEPARLLREASIALGVERLDGQHQSSVHA
jgi:hypothetical protein